MPVTYKECRFCDSQRSTTFEGERVCGGCGAEWDSIDVVYSDAEMQAMHDDLEQLTRELDEDNEDYDRSFIDEEDEAS
jgi:hypothetical protein